MSRLTGLEALRELTAEAVEVLMIVATLGEATQRQIDERRLHDSASLIDRLVRRDLLDKRTEEEL
jgi:chromosome segregation and condensation protein ScpB